MNELFFVYGTLKKGGALHRNIAVFDGELVSVGCIKASLYTTDHYPVAVKDDQHVIYGEVYSFPESKLEKVKRRLDQVEGYSEQYPGSSLYIREKVTVYIENEEKEAWAYFGSPNLVKYSHFTNKESWTV